MSLFSAVVARPNVNVARGQPSWSSTVYYESYFGKYMTSSLAFDGNPNPDYLAGSCMSTNPQNYPWLGVDLGRPSDVASVTVTNEIGQYCKFMSVFFNVCRGREFTSGTTNLSFCRRVDIPNHISVPTQFTFCSKSMIGSVVLNTKLFHGLNYSEARNVSIEFVVYTNVILM